MNPEVLEVLSIMQALKDNGQVLELLQALRKDFQLLDEKIVSGDTMYIIELISCIKNNLNELKEYFNSF